MLPLLALACTSSPPNDTGPVYAPLTWAVERAGPYGVGHRSRLVEYETPLGVLRTVRVNLWYPTLEGSGESVRYLGTEADPLSLGEATPADPAYGAGYPVYLHSHDHLGFGGQSAVLHRHLASHGWMVLAPDHTGDLPSDPLDPEIEQEIHRVSDLGAALAFLAEMDPATALGRADTEGAMLGGLGAGARTAWLAAGASVEARALESRCETLAQGCTNQELDVLTSGALALPQSQTALSLGSSIDLSMLGDSGHTSLSGPMLILTETSDGGFGASDFSALSGLERTWVALEGGCEQSFTTGDCADLPAETGFEALKGYATAMGRVHLLGDDTHADLLDGTRLLTEGLTVQGAD